MKKSTSLLTLLGLMLFGLANSLYAGEAKAGQAMPVNGSSKIAFKLGSIPHVKKGGGVHIQGHAEYRVVDSLFNAFSFYDNEQQPLCYDVNTGLFAVIKRGALPADLFDGNPNNSNCLRLLLSTDLGHSWLPSFPLYSGTLAKDGLPRYPSVDIAVPEGHTTADEAIFCFASPVTKNSTARTWEGSIIGYQGNDLSSSPGTNAMTATYNLEGDQYWWGSECIPTHYFPDDQSELRFAYGVDLVPLDTGTVNPANAPATALWSADFMNASLKPQLTIPAQWMPSVFTQVASGGDYWRVRQHIGMRRDGAGNFYNAEMGVFATNDDPQNLSMAVSKSTDHGTTWADFNIMPLSVLKLFAPSVGLDPDSVFFSQSVIFTTTNVIRKSSQSLVVYGNDQYSIFTQLFVNPTSETSAILVECYYKDGNWGMRKIADMSMFEDSDNWRNFDNGGTIGDSQMGMELQACVTADFKTLVCKYIEAKEVHFTNEFNQEDSLMSTDVVINTRAVDSNTWTDAVNVTQSDIIDRTTWLPTILPSDLRNIPLVTIQTADKGTTIADQLDLSQKKLATDQQSDYETYKQYLTLSNFDVAGLPPWDGFTAVSVQNDVQSSAAVTLSPNPSNDQVTIHVADVSSEMVVDVVNALGQSVLQKTIESVNNGDQYITLNTGNLTQGSYVLRLTSGSRSVSKKLVVVH